VERLEPQSLAWGSGSSITYAPKLVVGKSFEVHL
jgi:hypothetical protein